MSDHSVDTQARAMDRLYGGQVRLYDATRRYYLLGREPLLRRVAVAPGAHVCEVGTGTARNLIQLARRHPHGHFYGVDISAAMLAHADRGVACAGLAGRIALRRAAAEELDSGVHFGRVGFDAVFFSYCLSIVPAAALRPAIDAAWRSLVPGGVLHSVDFGPLASWPWPARALFSLVRRLGLFHATFDGHRPEVLDALRALAPPDHVEVARPYGGYALLVSIRKPLSA
jgi:S-adenosylmethionine-diacylgycerolhomoserine-N-methlytransferase